MSSPSGTDRSIDAIRSEITARFGVCPSFFLQAADSPAAMEELWRQARFAYLDSPMPSLLKEKLFTYLSRFCEVRYCVARHCAFLLGRGRPAGDPACRTLSVAEALALLSEPFPEGDELEAHLRRVEEAPAPAADWPDDGSPLERAVLVSCALVFLQPSDGRRPLAALRRLLGCERFHRLMHLLAFIRTAHFWAQAHPELELEEDVEQLLREQRELADRLRHDCGAAGELRSEARELREARRQGEGLRAANERLRAVLDTAADGIITFDEGGAIESANPAALAMFGYAPGELTGRNVRTLLPTPSPGLPRPPPGAPEPGAPPGAGLPHHPARAGPAGREVLGRRKDGSVFPLDVAVGEARLGDRRLFTGIFRDITDRVRAERALRDSEERFRTLADNIAQFAWMADGSGWTFWFNRRWFDYTGTTLEEVEGWGWRKVHHPDHVGRVVEKIRNCFEAGVTWEDTFPLRGRDGEYRWFLSRAVPIRDASGRVLRWFGTNTDVTEQLRAEQALRESEQRFRLLADSAPVMIWLAGPDKRRTWVNKGWLEFTGRTLEQELGDGWAAALHPDDLGRYLDGCAGAFDRREPLEAEYRLRRRDGEYRWVLDRGLPRFDGGGGFAGYIGSCIDITERKRIEGELEVARQAAEAASRAKSEFLANMSHEIRTPMTAILGYADLLARHLTDPDDLQNVETIRRNGRFLLEILDDILDLSKIEAGRLEVCRQRFSPVALVEDVRSLMEVRAREKGLPLVVEYAGPLPETVESDPKRLRQVLVNLVGNAVKFTERGEVRLAARLLGCRRRLRFDVTDTGAGICPELRERLFRPFTQADASATRQQGGTGLGLAISRRLAEMLGGEIAVESEPGRGSTFSVTVATGPLEGVPLVEPRPRPRDPGRAEPPAARRLSCRVLVADDRREVRYLAQHFIEDAGGEVVTAANGQKVLDLVRRARDAGEPIDAVVLDIQMPVMDGYETARRLRAMGFDRPVIALTAHAMQGDREKCLEAGCDDYTTKPVDGPELVRLLAHYTQDVPPQPPSRSAEACAPPPPRPPAGRVLLVDDHPDVRRIQQMLLEMQGHEVETAGDGRSAVEAAARFRPDVVLLDIRLPDMSGREVVRRLRVLPELAGTLFIAVSGLQDEAERRKSLEAGFHHYLVKPVDVDELESLLAAKFGRPG